MPGLPIDVWDGSKPMSSISPADVLIDRASQPEIGVHDGQSACATVWAGCCDWAAHWQISRRHERERCVEPFDTVGAAEAPTAAHDLDDPLALEAGRCGPVVVCPCRTDGSISARV